MERTPPASGASGGSATCLNWDLQRQRAGECLKIAEIGLLSNLRYLAPASRVKTSIVFGMTSVATGMPRPRFQKDRLDFRLEDMKIKSIADGEAGCADVPEEERRTQAQRGFAIPVGL